MGLVHPLALPVRSRQLPPWLLPAPHFLAPPPYPSSAQLLDLTANRLRHLEPKLLALTGLRRLCLRQNLVSDVGEVQQLSSAPGVCAVLHPLLHVLHLVRDTLKVAWLSCLAHCVRQRPAPRLSHNSPPSPTHAFPPSPHPPSPHPPRSQ